MSNEERKQGSPEEEIQPGDQPVEEGQELPEVAAEEPKADNSAAATQEEPAETGEDAPQDEPDSDAGTLEEVTALSEKLEITSRERDDYLDALRRLKAEFENSRKRQERERQRILQTASERLITELLPVLDNLDRALDHEGDIREGVRATRDQLADVLGREGLLPVASDGQSFDPNVHEAVMSQPSEDHEEGTIIQTFERGYVLNGKPIRAAKVVVASQG
ncbi:MAG TPA: nucleotide exchange factor GrpE [Rubrobacteraceae bacterium]|nr:nucleotide exchange factor GrpE [Rubrobacteraceae bacterium]